MVLYDTRWNKVNMGVLVAKETALSDTLGQHQADCILKAYSEACDSINHRGIRHYAKYIGVKDVVNDSLLQEFRFSGVHAPSQTDINKATMWLNK